MVMVTFFARFAGLECLPPRRILLFLLPPLHFCSSFHGAQLASKGSGVTEKFVDGVHGQDPFT
jgi:hypothetical protein